MRPSGRAYPAERWTVSGETGTTEEEAGTNPAPVSVRLASRRRGVSLTWRSTAGDGVMAAVGARPGVPDKAGVACARCRASSTVIGPWTAPPVSTTCGPGASVLVIGRLAGAGGVPFSNRTRIPGSTAARSRPASVYSNRRSTRSVLPAGAGGSAIRVCRRPAGRVSRADWTVISGADPSPESTVETRTMVPVTAPG